MGISSSTAAGPNTGTDSTKAASRSQAMWRFLHNDSVAIQALIEPLKEAARDGCSCSKSQFVLIMHDWSKLDFKTHKSKMDKVQLTRKNDVGYDLTASLSFFKLVKSSGQQIECWQQSDGMAIMRRLLVGSMACVYVWRLLADESEEAAQKREHLIKLSGRQTKRGVRATASGLLAGWYALLSVLSLLESGTTVEQLRKYAQTHAPPGFFV